MELEEPLTREDYVLLARLSEKVERYDEMAGFMHKMVLAMPSLEELTVEERNLVSIAYKNLVASPRAAWRITSYVENKEGRRKEVRAAIIKHYRARIEADIESICGRILGLIDSHLMPSAVSCESKVFYVKMKADYHRYLAEFKVGEERKAEVDDAMAFYKEAQDLAFANLEPTHPVRLGVSLNFSVFYYEILNSKKEARNMAKQAFDVAAAELNSLCELSYKDSTVILHLLRDNIVRWTCNVPDRIREA